MKAWSLFPTISASMPFQMAVDEILFRQMIEDLAAGKPTRPLLRFYDASEPCVTVGYSYPAGPAHVKSEMPVCRRLTGGGRVQHGKDFIFSLIAKKDDDETFKSVRVSYWKIHEAVKTALEHSGRKPRFYRCDEKLPRGGECFLYPISSDLALGERKVAGGAQKRSAGVMLHQESIRKIRGLPAEDLMPRLRGGFETVFDVTLEKVCIHPEMLAQARALAAQKYENSIQTSRLSNLAFQPNEIFAPAGV